MSDRDVITVEGDCVTLRATGVGRYVEAVFLGVWIVFWAIGEAVVLAVVGSMLAALLGFLRDSDLTRLGRAVLERAPGFEIGFMAMFLFLMVWLALWTLGGLAALYNCLRLLAGSDRLTVTGGHLELTWHAGPVHRTHHFDRSRLRRIRIRSHDKAVVADRAREEWIARDQQLEYRMRFGPLVRERRFRNAHFQMTSHTDSDGDTRYKLLVRDDAKKRTIASSHFDDTEVVDCARWMEAATGFRLVK